MRKIYNLKQYVRVNGEKKWRETLYNYNLMFVEEEIENDYPKIYKATTWEEGVNLVNNYCVNCKVQNGFFSKKPKYLVIIEDFFNNTYIDERHFKSLEMKYEVEEFMDTIDTLMKHLTADDLCEYLKDRGVQYVISK